MVLRKSWSRYLGLEKPRCGLIPCTTEPTSTLRSVSLPLVRVTARSARVGTSECSLRYSLRAFFIRIRRRILEMASTIKSTFEPVIQTNLYPRSQIDIFVQVLQQDGGLLQACINGTTLALANAGIPLLDFVCAVTGGVHSTSPMLDLTLLEENDLPNVTVAMMPRTGKVTLVTMETRLHVDRFEEIFRLAFDAGRVNA